MNSLEQRVVNGQLLRSPCEQTEFVGMVSAGELLLADCQQIGLTDYSQFSLAYNALYHFACAGLRWHGYRSQQNDFVLKSLAETIELNRAEARMIAMCDKVYSSIISQGQLEINPQLLKEFIVLVQRVQIQVKQLA